MALAVLNPSKFWKHPKALNATGYFLAEDLQDVGHKEVQKVLGFYPKPDPTEFKRRVKSIVVLLWACHPAGHMNTYGEMRLQVPSLKIHVPLIS